MEVAGRVLAAFLVQKVDGALDWEGIVYLGVYHEGGVVIEVDIRLQIFDRVKLQSVVR